MKKSRYIKVFLLISLMISGISCSKDTRLSGREKKFGTQGKNKWVFHRLSDVDKGTTLAFPGYIIGIEKAFRKKIGASSKTQIKAQNKLDVNNQFGFKDIWDSLPHGKQIKLYDQKAMFISSIHEFVYDSITIDRISTETFYDVYDSKYLLEPKDAFTNSFSMLDSFKANLQGKIKKDDITHVFFFSMGWNSDQQEAIRNFNSLFSKIIENGSVSGKKFHPLFIGITWPSKWNDRPSNALSFFNKTNDADEIGMTWGNYILNKVILANDMPTIKTVVVGHSFGAKLTSRATMSAGMLATNSKKVDLLINLQSAYSINRYSQTKGWENKSTKEYVDWSKYAKNIVMICSEHDKAVKAGYIYAPFAGAKKSYDKVEKYKDKGKKHYEDIKTVKYTNYLFDSKPSQLEGGLLLIDCSEIIKKPAHKKGGNAHSDIYNKEVSKLLWDLIELKTY